MDSGPRYDGYGQFTEHGRREDEKMAAEIRERMRSDQERQTPSSGSSTNAHMPKEVGWLISLYLALAVVGFYARQFPPWGYWTVVLSAAFLIVRKIHRRRYGVLWRSRRTRNKQLMLWTMFPPLCYVIHFLLQSRWDSLIGYVLTIGVVGGVLMVLVWLFGKAED